MIAVHSNSWFTGAYGGTDDYQNTKEIGSDQNNEFENTKVREDQKFNLQVYNCLQS